jgi:hypothetical protein
MLERIRRIGRPAAVARRAARRVDSLQMLQAYPPQRGIGKWATKENARTASLAVVRTGALPPYPRDLTHWGRQQGWGIVAKQHCHRVNPEYRR